MRRTKRERVIVETYREIELIMPAAIPAHCRCCGEQFNMVSVDAAAALSHLEKRTIYRWVELNRLHYCETEPGLLLICLNSLTEEINLSRKREER